MTVVTCREYDVADAHHHVTYKQNNIRLRDAEDAWWAGVKEKWEKFSLLLLSLDITYT
jgi:hypothetical protein